MKIFYVTFAALLTAGCATTEISYGDVHVRRTSIGTTTSVGEFELTRSPDGSAHVLFEQASTDQVQGLRAVAEGVTAGLMKGMKP